MKVVRQDESNISPYHSLYFEQLDWKVKIDKKDHTLAYLKKLLNNW